MIGSDRKSAHARTLDPVQLDVLLLTDDERLARRVALVCGCRDHDLSIVHTMSDLRLALERQSYDVLLLDATESPTKAVAIAAQLVAAHSSVHIALATAGHEGRSAGGFRLVDVRRPRERVADELELTYIGIPASVHDASAEAPA